ncbi:DCC1-like thiol-disulfide oxidoreductase family protein [Microbulbifer sp. NBRC 101763]|uniref:thiol-disulfide oxidoreductase DCC family protein n=1 Tax=Microbulbifer sp. NBRC 101763 TaxID=1113820 RepID=UPI0033420C49
MLPPTPKKIVIFDSICNLCNGWSRLLLKYDNEHYFTLCRAQSAAGQYLLQKLGMPLQDFETMVLLERENGSFRQYHKSDAALRIAASLTGYWRLIALLRYIPRPARDLLYDLIARNRYRWFGRRNSCLLPRAADEHRFLEEVSEENPNEPV